MPWRDGPAQPFGSQLVGRTGTTYAKIRAYSLALAEGFISQGFESVSGAAHNQLILVDLTSNRGPVFPPNVGPRRCSLEPTRTQVRLASDGDAATGALTRPSSSCRVMAGEKCN